MGGKANDLDDLDRTGRYDSDYTLQSFVIGHQWQTVTVSLTDLVTERSSRSLALDG